MTNPTTTSSARRTLRTGRLSRPEVFRPSGASPSPHVDAVHAGLVLLPLRIFLAAGWLRAAAEKLIDVGWWRGDTLRAFLDGQRGAQLPYFEPIAEHVIRPFAPEVALIVVLAQVLIGLSLAFGRPLRVALWSGVVLNVVFIMVGRVNPSAFYLFMEVALLYGVSVGTIGHIRNRRSLRPGVTVTVLSLLALSQIPFIRTIEPANVIEDPAMMLTFLCLAVMVTTLLRVTRTRARTRTDAVAFVSQRNMARLWSLLLCRPEWSLKYSSVAHPITHRDPTPLMGRELDDRAAPWEPPRLLLDSARR